MSQDPRFTKPSSIKEILAKTLPQMFQSIEPELIDLSHAWKTLVGSAIAQKTEPYRLYHGILTIHTKSPAWTQELQFLKYEILQKIQKKFPSLKIQDLRFQNKARIQAARKKTKTRT